MPRPGKELNKVYGTNLDDVLLFNEGEEDQIKRWDEFSTDMCSPPQLIAGLAWRVNETPPPPPTPFVSP